MGLLTEGLTTPDPVLAAQLAESVPGMAHFAGTGPAGLTCRSCVHWGASDEFKRTARTGELRRRRCQQFIRLMRGKSGRAIAHGLSSCRHFAYAEVVPEAVIPPALKPKKIRKSPKAQA